MKPPASPADQAPDRPPLPAPWVWALLLAATLLAYWPAVAGGLLWDDPAHVTRPDLRSLAGLGRIWLEPGATQQYYPLLHSAFWVEHRWWGDATPGYHLVNILLHAVAAGLLFQVLRRLAVPGAAVAAALFALHPVGVESVAWISEQKNTLSAALCFAAALAYLRFDGRRRRSDYVLATVLFVAALLAKSVTATLPAALLVVFWWRDGRLTWRQHWRPLLPWLGLGVAAGLGTAVVERLYVIADQGSAYDLSALQRVLLAGRMVWFYLGKLAWPADLVFIYPRWTIDAAVPWQWLPALAVVAVLAALAWTRRRGALTAALVYGGTLFPALGFVEVFPFRYSYVADHFQYLAAPAVFALAGAGLARLLAGRTARLAAGLLLAGLGLLARHQAGIYRDAETLYRATLARNPGCWLAEYNLGTTLDAAGRTAEAIPHLQRALELKPDLSGALNNLGLALLHAGRVSDALPPLERLVRVDPRLPSGHCNLGTALRAAHRPEAAIAEYETALRLDPEYADAAYDLGVALADVGRNAEAVARFRQATRLEPEFPPAWYGLGSSLQALGRLPEAAAADEAALRRQPDYPEVLNNLGGVQRDLGRLPDAVASFSRALRLRPDYPDAHNNLGTVYALSDRLPEALAEFEAAVRLDPASAGAQCNLARALALAGRVPEAIAHGEAAVRLRPDLAAAHLALAAALARAGRSAEADAEAAAARRLQPDR